MHIETVINKVGTIHAEYRYFDMELIAGEERYITTVTENKVKFQLDYSKVQYLRFQVLGFTRFLNRWNTTTLKSEQHF